MCKIKKRLSRWRARLLSFTKRVYLVKLVLKTIPLYYMSIFKVSDFLCHEIIKIKIYIYIWGWES